MIFSNSVNGMQIFCSSYQEILKRFIKEISLEGGLYSQVVMVWLSIMKIKETKEDSAEDKDKNNESSTNSKI